MPNIVEYSSPVDLAPRPDEAAASVAREVGATENRLSQESGRAIGGGIRAFGAPVQAMVDRAEQHTTFSQISHGAAVYSSMYGDLTQQWNQLAAKSDPNDTSVMQGFKEKVLGPTLENFQKGFEGGTPEAQKWALTRADSLQQHFTEKMIADMGTRAGVAVHQNIGDLERNYSNVVATDPSALSHIVDSLHTDVKAMIESSPNITPADAARVQGELVPKIEKRIALNAGYSIGKSNPQELIDALNKGDFDKYLDATEKMQALKYAEGVKHGKEADENRAYELAKRKQADAREAATNGYINDILTGRGVTAAKVAADPTLSPAERENIINFQHQHTMQLRERADTTPHPEVFRAALNDLFEKARVDPNNMSVQPIRKLFTEGKLNPREEAELEQRFNAMDKPFERNYLVQSNRATSLIRNSVWAEVTSKTDPAAFAQTLNQIDFDAHAKLDAERNRPGGDVNPLLDPKSPKYLFSAEAMRPYLSMPKEAVAAGAKKVSATEERQQWMQDTGGVLKPGQTQDQALEAWRATKGPAPASVTRTRDQAKAGEQYRAPDGSVRVKGGG